VAAAWWLQQLPALLLTHAALQVSAAEQRWLWMSVFGKRSCAVMWWNFGSRYHSQRSAIGLCKEQQQGCQAVSNEQAAHGEGLDIWLLLLLQPTIVFVGHGCSE
jgi:hypothetical protein